MQTFAQGEGSRQHIANETQPNINLFFKAKGFKLLSESLRGTRNCLQRYQKFKIVHMGNTCDAEEQMATLSSARTKTSLKCFSSLDLWTRTTSSRAVCLEVCSNLVCMPLPYLFIYSFILGSQKKFQILYGLEVQWSEHRSMVLHRSHIIMPEL